MKPVTATGIKEIIHAVPYRPAISVIIPFEPGSTPKAALAQTLKHVMDKTKTSLQQNYPKEICTLMQLKLRNVINHLNYSSFKKSIAIYISPVFEKVLYLDIPVEEKLVIDGSFEIRDLVYAKKELNKYLVLLLSNTGYKVFLGSSTAFVRLLSLRTETAAACSNDAPQRVSNFSDPGKRKDQQMAKFLLHLDKALHPVLASHPFPLFVVGTERIAGHFNKITRHSKFVVKYIQGNYDEATMEELAGLLQPHVAGWKKQREQHLLELLEKAAGSKKLAAGIKEVWRDAMQLKGRLLVVEKDYMVAAEQGAAAGEIHKPVEPYNKFSCITDAVDDIIEKVLDNGGDVEFADPPLLDPYQHIAMVKYY